MITPEEHDEIVNEKRWLHRIKFFDHQAYSKAVDWKYSVTKVFSKIS